MLPIARRSRTTCRNAAPSLVGVFAFFGTQGLALLGETSKTKNPTQPVEQSSYGGGGDVAWKAEWHFVSDEKVLIARVRGRMVSDFYVGERGVRAVRCCRR